MSVVMIDAVSEDTTSSEYISNGPILVSVSGNTKTAVAKIEANLGSGWVRAETIFARTDARMQVINFPAGVTFRVVLTKVRSTDVLTVEYMDAVY